MSFRFHSSFVVTVYDRPVTTRSKTPDEKPAEKGCRRRLAIAGLGVLALAAVLTITLMWRLNRGPIELGLLEQHLVWKLGAGEDALQLAVRNPVIAWGGWTRPADLRAGPVIVSDTQGRTVVEFEDVSVGIALRELFHKRVTLTRIEIRSIHVQLLRTTDGRIVLGFEAGKPREEPPPSHGQSVFQEKLREIFTSPRRVPPFDRLTLVSVADSQATIDDRVLGRIWRVPSLNLEMRPKGTGLTLSADATVDLEGQPTEVAVHASFQRTTQRLQATASVKAVNPAVVAQLAPQLGPLTNADVALDISVSGEVSTDGTVHSAGLDVASCLGQDDRLGDTTGRRRLLAPGEAHRASGRAIRDFCAAPGQGRSDREWNGHR